MGKKKIGVRVDKELWDTFRTWVEDHHGRTRGALSEEVEIALRERMQADRAGDKLTRIEDDVATIKAMLADAEVDGGRTVPDMEPRAPAEGSTTSTANADSPGGASTDNHLDGTDATKPAPNQPRAKKVAWLVERVDGDGGGSRTREHLAENIRDWFGFDDDVIDWYVDRVLDELDAEPIPQNREVFAWGPMLEQKREQARESAQQEAQDAMRDLSDGEPGA